MKKRKIKVPFKTIAIILLFLVTLFLFFRSLSAFLWNSDYFNIKSVVLNAADIKADLSYLKGRNIFALDLRSEAGKILSMYPGYHKISLVKQLPNRIKVDLLKRKPVAYVRLYRFFAVDEEAVLFDLDSEAARDPDLPVIVGLQTRIFGPKSGKSYDDISELALCLNLIRRVEGLGGLRGYKVKSIDVSRPEDFSFYISENIEVKIGQSNTGRKLRLLNSIIGHLGRDLVKVKYIDLRFKEPVIKYK